MVRKTKGKAGWFGQSKRHSEASVKGWNSRFGKKKVSLKDVKKIHAKRSNRAKTVDNLKSAKVVGKNRYAQWAGNPNRFDVKGVDTITSKKQAKKSLKKQPIKYNDKIEKLLKKGMLIPKVINEHWANGKPIIYKGAKYDVYKMSYGDYFLEPVGYGVSENRQFSPNVLWLEKVDMDGVFMYEVSKGVS